MGSIYKQKGSQNFYIKYYRNGRAFRESSGSPKEGVAKRLLRLREGDIERGIPITPKVGRLRFEEAAEDLLIDYRVNGRRSLVVAERRIRKHLTPFFGGRRMVAITTADVNRFIAKRQADTIRVRKARTIRTKAGWVTEPEQRKSVSNGEINRELTLLKRAFNLAIQAAKLINKPYIPLLKERNVRTGFFERHQFDSLCRHLPEVLVRMLTVAYITGWRVPSEIQTLEWRQVDFVAGELRLDPNTTKNDDGRVFPMTAELRAVLEQQWAITQALAKTSGRICPWVFHRDGKPIKSFKKRWQTASFKAGCPGRIPHDFRRTAVRNLVRAGVPERVAMQLTGHKTRSVFERYNIVSPGDLREAAEKLDVAAGIVLGIVRPLAAAGEQVISVFTEEKLEAPPGFEPGMEVLQTSALPLGDGAARTWTNRCHGLSG